MTATELYIDRALAHRAEAAQSGAFLIGSYAGWPNLGDYLQLRSTVDLHDQIGAVGTLFVVLDAQGRAAHERSKVSFGVNGHSAFPVYYHSKAAEPAGNGLDGLVRLPHVPHSMLVHVYGGGFINDWWGRPARHAVRALLDRHGHDHIDGQLRLFMSGLQVSQSLEVDAWRSFFTHAEYIGARDQETVTLLRRLVTGDPGKIHYCGDDALTALAAACKAGASPDGTLSIAAHVNLADYSSDDPDQRLDRLAQALAAAARHFGAGIICDLLIAYPSDHVREEEAARQLKAAYERSVASGSATPLTFRVRNIFEEAVNGNFHFHASFLATCSYHVALTGLLSHCPTLLLAENHYYRQKAAGLAEAFNTHQFATVGKDGDIAAVVGSLLERRSNQAPGNGSYAMWIGQSEKALRLSRVCLEMERAVARNRLDLTAGAFREVAANLGELRKRRILEQRLAKEIEDQTALTISIPTRGGLTKYMAKSYWRRRRSGWLRSIKKRIDKWN